MSKPRVKRWILMTLAGAVGIALATLTSTWAQQEQQARQADQASDAAVKANPSAKELAPADQSYAVGYSLGRNFRRRGITPGDPRAFLDGIQAGLGGRQPRLSGRKLQQAMLAFQQKLRQRMIQQRQQAGRKMAQQSQQFLQKNRQKEGVRVTDSGLQYQILRKGRGQSPQSGDKVRVQYRGQLVSGDVFDSSYKRGEPATFKVGQVIEGWNEALKMMKPGSKWRLVIPSDLAYGQRGAPPKIPPGSALVFTVELLKVQPSQTGS